jgi:Leucine-rich repeat (LRR) protein
MCVGAKAPNIVYQGPSQADIDRNRASLDKYESDMAQQQAAFETQLQAQIDAANKETAALEKKFQNQAAAAAAASAAQQTETPANAQTTAAITKKRKPRQNLKIARNALPAQSGAGLNIGV